MADISEVLLSINEVLQGYETEVKKAGAKVTVLQINGKERVEIREEIKEKLKKTRVNFEQKPVPESGFDGIELQETSSSILRIIFKTKGGGSGAGAAITELGESAQCVYAAVAFGLGRKITQSDITPKNVKAYENKFSVNGNLDKIMNQMTDEWMQSSVLGANELWEKFGSLRGVVFHRGDKTVDHIENQFKRIKKIEKIRIDINKWSPADIYITTPNYDPKCLQDEQSIRGLNQCMNERIDPKAPKMFGVSLKKMSGSSDLKLLNFDRKDASEKEFLKIEATQSSKDFYVVFKDGTKIQFRGFSGDNLSGWQGEVKGSKANQGKIGGGPVNLLLKIHGLDLVDIQVANKIKNNNQKVGVITKLKDNLKSVLGNEYSERELANMQMTMTEKEFNSWLYSKSQGAELAKIITSISNTTKQNQLCEDLYLYANSRSSISAPYYKLE
jgi:hypothetical protein|tara:strand:+ start:500 stop:1831 length:1332 start_codon:yes stop_codon:yes gene_type:complete